MPKKISAEAHGKIKAMLASMDTEWNDWKPPYKLLADYLLPRRYNWLCSPTERRSRMTKNPNILDATGTTAARILAAGLMNGITSPSRPWFKLRTGDMALDADLIVQRWLDEVQRRMLRIMADSNFYNNMAVMYLDLVVFGTATMIVYEDFETVVRCYNPACGEYTLAQNDALKIDTFARKFDYTLRQVVQRWGEGALSEVHRAKYKLGGAHLSHTITIRHLIEPNRPDTGIPSKFKFREVYWAEGAPAGELLDHRGYNEFPVLAARWETTGNDPYGTCPSMDALGDIIQLQHETKKKGQGLDKLVDPPVIADIQLRGKPNALLPRGVTYVAGINNVGVKAAYQVQIPLAELSADIQDVRTRIREIFHNDLFKMISQLETVRSATEIDARREEKLVLLAAVLERFQNEALDPVVNRYFQIMLRAGLLPEIPEQLKGAAIEVQYVSILSVAQSAVGAAPTERLLQVIAQIGQIIPTTLELPNWDEMLRDYARDIGVKASHIRTPEEFQAVLKQQQDQVQAQQAAVQGEQLVQGAKTLSETDVGGGSNALQALLA